MLKFPFVALVDRSVETCEHTLIDEVIGNTELPTINEVPGDTKVPRTSIEFTDIGRPKPRVVSLAPSRLFSFEKEVHDSLREFSSETRS